MMAGPFRISIDRDSIKLLENFEKLADREFLLDALDRFFQRQANIVAGRISRDFLSGQRLKRRTGTLARSIVGQSVRTGGIPGFRVGIFKGPALRYAAVQEFGTKGKDPSSPIPTIKPKKAKALAVPNPDGPAVTRAGVSRFDGPRQFPQELRFIPFRDSRIAVGGLYLQSSILQERQAAQQEGRKVNLRNVKLVYFLLKKVDITPQHYLRDGMEENLLEVANDLVKFLRDLLSNKPAVVR